MIIVNDHTTTKLVFAYFGLLGFAQVYGGRLFVYNPMRPDLLKLPVCDADQYFERSDIYGMGFNAAAGNYKLVWVLHHSKFYRRMAHVHVLCTNSWRT